MRWKVLERGDFVKSSISYRMLWHKGVVLKKEDFGDFFEITILSCKLEKFIYKIPKEEMEDESMIEKYEQG